MTERGQGATREVMCSHPSEPHGTYHPEGECPHLSGRSATWECCCKYHGSACCHDRKPDGAKHPMTGRVATWTIDAEGYDCPLCFHGVEMHDGESCTAPEGYDHLDGFHECGCPLTPPTRTTS